MKDLQNIQKDVLQNLNTRLDLNLTDSEMDSYDYSLPIFDDSVEGGLAIDSVEGLEIILMLKQVYSVELLEGDMNKLGTIESIATLIAEGGN